MLTRADIPKLLLPGLQTAFMQGLSMTPTTFQEYCMSISSNKKKEDYSWLGSTPKMREWKDERQASSLLEYDFSITNKSYEATIAVDRDALEDELYGQIKMRAQGLGQETNRFKDEFAATTVEAGTTGLAFDGQFFFDTDHVSGDSGTQSNKLIGASYQFGATGLKNVINNMMNLVDDKGKKLGLTPTHVMVPTALQWTAREVLDPSVLAAGGTTPAQNILKGRLQIIVNPYLANNGADSKYYVMDLSRGVKPFIYQTRKEAEFVALDQSTDTPNFFRKEVFYGVDARFAFGYGDWKLACLAAGA